MADNVATEHKDYVSKKGQWRKVRVAIEGEEAVKEAGAEFLPPLSNQGSYEYTAYKMRAMFYEATGRTLQGLVGALHYKRPTLTDPDGTEDEEFFDELVPSHIPFYSYLRDISEEVLTTGRIGLLVEVAKDVDSAGGTYPYLCSYTAEDIINWRTSYEGGNEILTLVVLKEKKPNPGMFETKYIDQWRVLSLDNGIYTQTVYQKDESNRNQESYFIAEGPIQPTKAGKSLDHIPFYFINSGGTTSFTYRPPLLALANVNLSHYRNSADLEHGRHFTGLPTAWIAGFEPDAKSGALQIGSSTAWVTPNASARAGYLEFTGQGLSFLEKALESKEGLMAILGARMLETPKNFSESADNQIIKRSSENSIMANFADIISEGMTKICKEAADWMGLLPDKVSIQIQREYMNLPVDAPFMNQLTQSLQNGSISYDTYFYNMKRMKVMPEDRTQEDELDLIDTGKFGGLAMPKIQPGGIQDTTIQTNVNPYSKVQSNSQSNGQNTEQGTPPAKV